ncbi:alpha/beta fold hydrolase [Nonomuraea sp. SBT364]|uniref:alpha/beta fold hydrolase n=1 Tax=Nonomuraea sp. SBT364 TaxID=1580530 RepID=UPI00066DF39A|nr:alpha/beta fold hydrolase [Nonomuraea sp. SBT364]
MRTPLLFVHGFWHGTWCWSEVLARVAETGRPALAVDLPGHGLRARRPRSVTGRPFDPDHLATEPSPVAGVGLDEAGEALVSQLKRLGRGGPVTVVAHSMGGTVLTRAAEQAPELVAHAVYLAAFMPASGVSAFACAEMPENAGELIAPSVRADPAVVGALRLDLGSADAAYRQQLREAFYGDVSPEAADAAIGLMTPDAPARIALGTTTLTRQGWGGVPRTYVGCSRDMTIRPPLQRRFVAEADAAFPGNPTSTVTLDAAHSPFLSQPGRVAEIVGGLG